MPKGKFIVFSGGEGSGKTSVIARLKVEFPHIVVSREPGGTPVGQKIRAILLEDAILDPDAVTEAFLFLADRNEHVVKVVRPQMVAGLTVISDRYWMDTFAYQWYATMRRLDLGNFLDKFREFRWPDPDLWVWMDVHPETGLRRRSQTGEVNRIDQRDLYFHQWAREGFRFLFEEATALHPGMNFPKVAINATVGQEEVYQEVKRQLLPFLKS